MLDFDVICVMFSAAEIIYENVDADANIIFGALVDEKMTSGEVAITVLATGFSTDFFDSLTSGEKAEDTASASRKRSNAASVSTSASTTSATGNKAAAGNSNIQSAVNSNSATNPNRGSTRHASSTSPVSSVAPASTSAATSTTTSQRSRYSVTVDEEEHESYPPPRKVSPPGRSRSDELFGEDHGEGGSAHRQPSQQNPRFPNNRYISNSSSRYSNYDQRSEDHTKKQQSNNGGGGILGSIFRMFTGKK
jgi:hypothetical protein